MKKKPSILIDIDGVLANFDTGLINLIKEHFVVDMSSIDFTQNVWDIMDLPGLSHLKDQIWDVIVRNHGFVYNLNKYNYADTFVQELRNIGQLIACTSAVNEGTFAGERCNWLMDKLSFHRHDIILAHRKYLVSGDYLIDDKEENIIEWLTSNPKGIGFLFQSPGRPVQYKGGHSDDIKRRLHHINQNNLDVIYTIINGAE